MVLVKWDPWADMLSAQRDMHDTLRRFFGDWWTPASVPGFQGSLGSSGGAFIPAVEAFARDGDLVVRAELPGIDPEKDVEITVQNGTLVIRGERRREEQHTEGQWVRSETRYGSFERHVLIPDGVEPDAITATYRDGILEVVVPQAAALPEPKRIPVLTGGQQKALSAKGRKK